MGDKTDDPTIIEDPTGKIGKMILDMLHDKFQDDFVYDHIIVEIRTDHLDEEYVHTYIVLDGDFDKLDPKKTLEITSELWDLTKDMNYPAIPIQSYIERSECKPLKRALGMKRCWNPPDRSASRWLQRATVRLDRCNYQGVLNDLRHAATARTPTSTVSWDRP